MFAELRTIQVALPAQCRLGLIADTHIYDGGRRTLPAQVLDCFARSEVDWIVHCGDIACQRVIDQLAAVAPTLAVRGNNDSGDFGRDLPHLLELTTNERVIRVVHGDGGRSARAIAAEHASGAAAVIYGHSHIPRVEMLGECLLLNPGSPNDRRWHPHFGVGFLEITSERLRPEIVLFETPENLDRAAATWRSNR